MCEVITHARPKPASSTGSTLLRNPYEGFIILDHYGPRFDDFQQDMRAWISAGLVKLREDVIDGLENTPAAFIGLLEGRNFSKLVVRVADV